MKPLSRRFKLILGSNLDISLRKLGDSTHFLDTIVWGHSRLSFSERDKLGDNQTISNFEKTYSHRRYSPSLCY